MFKVSEIISLPVINLFTLKIEGTIENVLFDGMKMRPEYLVVYSEEEEVKKIVEVKNIYKVGTDCIFITNPTKITLLENMELKVKNMCSPLNALCFNYDGTNLGKVNEVYTEKNAITNIEASGKKYGKNDIMGFSDKVVMISHKKINRNNFRPNNNFKILAKESQKVSTLFTKPIQEATNYSHLLKQRVKKDIKNDNGELIAKSGSIITFNLLNKLKHYGKIKELSLNNK